MRECYAVVGSRPVRRRRLAGTGKKGRREEDGATGGSARKKPRSLCPHQRKRSACKECGGAGICPHQRRRGRCKECGGAGICQHQRIRSRCKECWGGPLPARQRSKCMECREESDKSMPAGLEELEEAGV